MAARKQAKRPATRATNETANDSHLRVLTRTARIGQAVERNPKSKGSYADEIANARSLWQGMTPDARRDVRTRAADHMTKDAIASAVATLED
jgi:hypothetical protein